VIDVNQAAGGQYTVQVTDAIGCVGFSVITVEVKAAPQINIASDKLNGCVPLCVNIVPSNTADLSIIVWEFGDGNVTTGMSASSCYNTAGNYFVKATYTDKTGCKNISNLAIQAYPIPVADFNFAPTKPTVNETIEFMDASSEAKVTQWTWSFSHQSSKMYFTQNLNMLYENPGAYAVALMVVSDHGCKDTIVKQIVVEEDFAIYVPDAFSPNGDGVNDVFLPKGVGITRYEMNIFDRWGERIFTSNDMENGWDGSFPRRGTEELKQDVYVWHIKLMSVRGKAKEISGKVTLMKEQQIIQQYKPLPM
jgi:gliding motility-associated-like protein